MHGVNCASPAVHVALCSAGWGLHGAAGTGCSVQGLRPWALSGGGGGAGHFSPIIIRAAPGHDPAWCRAIPLHPGTGSTVLHGWGWFCPRDRALGRLLSQGRAGWSCTLEPRTSGQRRDATSRCFPVLSEAASTETAPNSSHQWPSTTHQGLGAPRAIRARCQTPALPPHPNIPDHGWGRGGG